LSIGGIRLRVKGVSEVRIQTEGGKITLLNILYILGLNTNLLSGGILYKADLHGSFNEGVIYIRADNSSLIFKVIKRDNIYIIN
jgi:hypothetical protein